MGPYGRAEMKTTAGSRSVWLKHEALIAGSLLALQLLGLALLRDGSLLLVMSAPLCLTLALLAIYDLRFFILPDTLTLPLLITGLTAGLLVSDTAGVTPGARLAGAAGGYLALYLLNKIYQAWRGRDGLGLGDAKLMAAAGAWLGLWALPALMLIASLLGLAAGLGILLLRRPQAEPLVLPFGPFISAAFLFLWFSPVQWPGW